MGEPLDLDAIEAQAEAATPGPWFRDVYEDGEEGEGPTGVYPGSRGPMVESNDVMGPPIGEEQYANDVASCIGDANAAFIAAARTNVPALVAEVRKWQKATEEEAEARGKAEGAYMSAVAEIRNLLASAHPHPKEHPTMTAAWKRARAFLGDS